MPRPINEPAAEAEDVKDLILLLDRELDRLPGKYRAAVVLCDLNGKSRKEAAGQLGLPEGTLSSRLRTARGMLARRLARHQPLFAGAALAALLARNAARAAPPAALVSATIKAGPLVAAGQAAVGNMVSAKVAALAEGVLKGMLLNKIKLAAVMFLLLSLLASGINALRRGLMGLQLHRT